MSVNEELGLRSASSRDALGGTLVSYAPESTAMCGLSGLAAAGCIKRAASGVACADGTSRPLAPSDPQNRRRVIFDVGGLLDFVTFELQTRRKHGCAPRLTTAPRHEGTTESLDRIQVPFVPP